MNWHKKRYHQFPVLYCVKLFMNCHLRIWYDICCRLCIWSESTSSANGKKVHKPFGHCALFMPLCRALRNSDTDNTTTTISVYKSQNEQYHESYDTKSTGMYNIFDIHSIDDIQNKQENVQNYYQIDTIPFLEALVP